MGSRLQYDPRVIPHQRVGAWEHRSLAEGEMLIGSEQMARISQLFVLLADSPPRPA